MAGRVGDDAPPVALEPRATPLMDAALWGNATAVRRLLDQGADPNARNDAGATPVMRAVIDLEKTRLLLERGADVNAQSDDGRTPLLIAAGLPGAAPVVKLLLDDGAAINVKAPGLDGEMTPLAEAMQSGDADCLSAVDGSWRGRQRRRRVGACPRAALDRATSASSGC